MKDASGPEACDPMKNCGPREALLPELLEQRHMKRLMMPLVGLSHEDSNQDLVPVEDAHGSSPSLRSPASRIRCQQSPPENK